MSSQSFSHLTPEIETPPEPECRPGLKAYKGYAAMSRAHFFEWQKMVGLKTFYVYLCLYNWAIPLGTKAGTVSTSREELAERLRMSPESLDRELSLLSKYSYLIEIVTSVRGRPRGGRGHSRTPGRLVIRITNYQTALEAGSDGPE